MKGKISFYFTAENLGKVRSRLANPPKEFSADMRQAITDAVIEVVNKNIIDTRAVLIRKFQEKGYVVSKDKYAADIANVLQPFFDVVVSSEKPEGSDNAEEEAPAEDAPADPAPAEDAPADPAPAEDAPADDEFSD